MPHKELIAGNRAMDAGFLKQGVMLTSVAQTGSHQIESFFYKKDNQTSSREVVADRLLS